VSCWTSICSKALLASPDVPVVFEDAGVAAPVVGVTGLITA
jgi:hypothetical protein